MCMSMHVLFLALWFPPLSLSGRCEPLRLCLCLRRFLSRIENGFRIPCSCCGSQQEMHLHHVSSIGCGSHRGYRIPSSFSYSSSAIILSLPSGVTRSLSALVDPPPPSGRLPSRRGRPPPRPRPPRMRKDLLRRPHPRCRPRRRHRPRPPPPPQRRIPWPKTARTMRTRKRETERERGERTLTEDPSPRFSLGVRSTRTQSSSVSTAPGVEAE